LQKFQTPKQKMEMGTSYKNSSEHQTNGYQELRQKTTEQGAKQRRGARRATPEKKRAGKRSTLPRFGV